ncbi:cytochrome b [Ectothiorhodospiraceae bacterium WFHF3C12]|nr:cytochrome b [Ectothiorhodospiraceae bacterium WFHF3C12]
MRLRNSDQHWGLVAQLLHWLIAVLIVVMAALGWYMTTLKISPTMFELYALHKSIGITILTLVVLRVAWRASNPTPALPGHMRTTERRLAHITHGLLYLILFAMPISGYVINSAAAFPLKVFGLFTIPNVIPENEAVKEAAQAFHETLIWVLIGILVLHVAGALKHHFVDRDNVLRRMIPGAERSSS